MANFKNLKIGFLSATYLIGEKKTICAREHVANKILFLCMYIKIPYMKSSLAKLGKINPELHLLYVQGGPFFVRGKSLIESWGTTLLPN